MPQPLKAIRYSTPYVVGTISGFAVRSLQRLQASPITAVQYIRHARPSVPSFTMRTTSPDYRNVRSITVANSAATPKTATVMPMPWSPPSVTVSPKNTPLNEDAPIDPI